MSDRILQKYTGKSADKIDRRRCDGRERDHRRPWGVRLVARRPRPGGHARTPKEERQRPGRWLWLAGARRVRSVGRHHAALGWPENPHQGPESERRSPAKRPAFPGNHPAQGCVDSGGRRARLPCRPAKGRRWSRQSCGEMARITLAYSYLEIGVVADPSSGLSWAPDELAACNRRRPVLEFMDIVCCKLVDYLWTQTRTKTSRAKTMGRRNCFQQVPKSVSSFPF